MTGQDRTRQDEKLDQAEDEDENCFSSTLEYAREVEEEVRWWSGI